MVAARSPYVFWSLFLVNLMNHELAGFLLPWLWFLRRQQDGRWRTDLVCIGVAGVIYASFYMWVKVTAAPMFNVDYFLKHPLFPGGTFVVWSLAAVHWTCAFGPMLAVLAWQQHSPSLGAGRWHFWLVLLGILVIFCIAFDWARHSNLIVLPLVVASAHFLAGGARRRLLYVGLLMLSVFLFWLVPPWSSSAWPTSLFANDVLLLDSKVVVPGPGPGLDIGFGPLSAAVGNWLPAIWLPLTLILSVLFVIWLAGALLARWQCDMEHAGDSR